MTPAQAAAEIRRVAGALRPRQAFQASVELMFHALAQQPNPDFDHEAAHMAVVARCRDAGALDIVRATPALMAATVIGVHGGLDFLGSVAAELGSLEKSWGQYFTPPEVCRLCAALMIDETGARAAIARDGWVRIHEPAAGGGAMLLAMAERLHDFGIDVGRQVFVEAWELDAAAARMCFVQLALRGVPARVVVGNTLTLEKREMWVNYPLLRVVSDRLDRQAAAVAAE